MNISRVKGALSVRGLVFFSAFQWLYFSSLYAAVDPAQCDADIGVSVPSFKCSDGVEVNDFLNPNLLTNPGGVCDHPEELNNRCLNHAYVGDLAKDNDDVDIIFSCRPVKPLTAENANRTYHDIAVIQHSRKTGATCFYQAMKDTKKDDKIPAAKTSAGKAFFNQQVDYCGECHTNGPFIRTPHYQQATYKQGGVTKHVLPKYEEIKRYFLSAGNNTDFEIYNVYKSGNGCLGCHNIGAYSAPTSHFNYYSPGTKLLGKASEVASGHWKSLSGNSIASHTTSGYDAYMKNYASDPVAAVEELEGCLDGKTKGCTLIPLKVHKIKGSDGHTLLEMAGLSLSGSGSNLDGTILTGVSAGAKIKAQFQLAPYCQDCSSNFAGTLKHTVRALIGIDKTDSVACTANDKSVSQPLSWQRFYQQLKGTAGESPDKLNNLPSAEMVAARVFVAADVTAPSKKGVYEIKLAYATPDIVQTVCDKPELYWNKGAGTPSKLIVLDAPIGLIDLN